MCVDSSVYIITQLPRDMKIWWVIDFFPSLPTKKHSINGCPISYRKGIIFARDYNSVEIGLNIIMPSNMTQIHRASKFSGQWLIYSIQGDYMTHK